MRPGSLVRYWPGAREGVGRVGRTRSEVWELSGQPVVSIHGYPGGIALTHVELIEDAPKRPEVRVVPPATPYPVHGWHDSDSAAYSAGSADCGGGGGE